MNALIESVGCAKRASNFGNDLSDSVCLAYLVAAVDGTAAALEEVQLALKESDYERRAELVLQSAERIGCRQFASPQDIVAGTKNLNLAFVAVLYNAQKAGRDQANEERRRREVAERAQENFEAQLRRYRTDLDETRKQRDSSKEQLQHVQTDLSAARQQVRSLEAANEKLREKFDALEIELQKLRQLESERDRQLQSSDDMTRNLRSELNAARDLARSLESRNAELRDANRELEATRDVQSQQLDLLRDRLRSVEDQAVATQAQARDQISQLQQEVQVIRQQAKQNESQSEEFKQRMCLQEREVITERLRAEELERKVRILEDSQRSIQNDLQASRDLVRTLENKNGDLRLQLRNAEACNENSARSAGTLEDRLRQLEDVERSLNAELNSSRKLSAEFEQANAALREQVKQLNSRLDDAERRSREQEHRNKINEERLHQFETEKREAQDQAQHANAKVQRLQDRLNELEDAQNNLKNASSRDSDTEQQVLSLREELSRLRLAKDAEISKVQARLAGKEHELVQAANDLINIRDNARAQASEQEERIRHMESELTLLKDQIRNYEQQKNILADEAGETERRLQELNARAAQAEAERVQLKQQLKQTKEEASKARLEREVVASELQSRVSALEEELSLAKKELTLATEQSRVKIESIETARDALVTKLNNQLMEREKAANAASQAATQTYAALNRETQSLRSRAEKAEDLVAQLRNELEDERHDAINKSEALSKELQSAKADASTARDEVKSLQAAVAEHRESIRSLQKTLACLEQDAKAFTSIGTDDAQLRSELFEARQANARLDEQLDSRTRENEQLRMEHSRITQALREDLALSRKAAEDAQSDVVRVRSELGELQKKYQADITNLSKVEQRLSTSLAELNSLPIHSNIEKELDTLKTENNNLRDEISRIRNEQRERADEENRLAEELNKARQKASDFERIAKDTIAQFEVSRKRNDELSRSVDTLFEENISLQKTSKQLERDRLDFAEKGDSLRQQIANLERINVALMNQRSILIRDEHQADLARVENALNLLKAEFGHVIDMKDSTRVDGDFVKCITRKFKEIDQKASKASKDLEDLKASIETLNDENSSLRKKKEEMEQELRQSRDELRRQIAASAQYLDREANIDNSSDHKSIINVRSAQEPADASAGRVKDTVHKAMKAMDALRDENLKLKRKVEALEETECLLKEQLSTHNSEEIQRGNAILKEKLLALERLSGQLLAQRTILIKENGALSPKATSEDGDQQQQQVDILDALLQENATLKLELQLHQKREDELNRVLVQSESNLNDLSRSDAKMVEVKKQIDRARLTTASSINLVVSLKKENKKLREKLQISEEIEVRLRDIALEEKRQLQEKLSETEKKVNALLAQRNLLIEEREKLSSSTSLDKLSGSLNSAHQLSAPNRPPPNIPRNLKKE
ncbi:phospholipid scramblase 1 [Phlyctochytrium bullatum]|nr:phospholipid scramblase 1 [Phlyctochytrium bullatum]